MTVRQPSHAKCRLLAAETAASERAAATVHALSSMKSMVFGADPHRPRRKKEVTDAELDDPEFRKIASCLDADVFRGLREEMEADEAEDSTWNLRSSSIYDVGRAVVTTSILLNAVQMGLSTQDAQGRYALLWDVMEHIFTVVFTVEMCAGLCFSGAAYFLSSWNIMDFVLVWLAIADNWLFPATGIDVEVGVFMVLRMLRVLRIVRLLRAAAGLRILVEGMFTSMASLGWILILLIVNTYLFGIICCHVLLPDLYVDMPDFDFIVYFGDVGSAMLTMFNVCILAEWQEVIRPVWAKQPLVVFCVFLPYLMLCTFGVLNLIIGVIAEQTMAAGQGAKDAEMHRRLRDKMKAIMKMTDEMFDTGMERMTKHDFEKAAIRHPDFVDLIRKCDFPRGFAVESLHLIFDESGAGAVNKEEFITGMFRMVFNSIDQHMCTLLLNISQVKNEIKTHVEDELERLVADLVTHAARDELAVLPSLSSSAPRPAPGEAQEAPSRAVPASSPCVEGDGGPSPEAPQGCTTSSSGFPGALRRQLEELMAELRGSIEAEACKSSPREAEPSAWLGEVWPSARHTATGAERAGEAELARLQLRMQQSQGAIEAELERRRLWEPTLLSSRSIALVPL